MTLANMARMSTATTGTGTITLGSAVSGFLSFAGAGITNGQTVSYAIEDGSNREVGRGVYTSSGTTLTRSVLKSTNSNAAISLSGTAQVFITALAEDIVAPALVFIAAYSPSGVATMDITSGLTSAYDEYELHLQNFVPASGTPDLWLRTSTNGGSSFDAGAGNYQVEYGSGALSDTNIFLGTSDGTFSGLSGVLRLIRPSVAQYFQVLFHTGAVIVGPTPLRNIGVGVRATAADVDAIRLLFSSGNIATGFAKLYGVQKS